MNNNELQENVKKKSSLGNILLWVLFFGLFSVVAIQLSKAQAGGIKIGELAPDFVLTTFDGEDISLSSLSGKVIVMNFWASWCIECGYEAEELQTSWEFYEQDNEVIFLGVDWTDTDKEAAEYINKYEITYKNGPDYGTRISQAYHLTGVPETYIIDGNGILRYVKIGPFLSVQEINSQIELALDQE
jgi:cytochrome c biogenesis protein CcmG, thiol:disulfide interchange protein DsbE